MKLKEIRKDKCISQEILSKKSGISRTTISKIENNEEKIVTSETLKSLAKALEVTLDDLLCS